MTLYSRQAWLEIVRKLERFRHHMKIRQSLQQIFRALGILEIVEEVCYRTQRLRLNGENTRFLMDHPEAALPPLPLLYEIGGRIRLSTFLKDGLASATFLTTCARTWLGSGEVSILGWGCGVACVVRHMPDLLGNGSRIFGSNYNREMIAWAHQALPRVTFEKNELLPPLEFEARSLDWVYGLSVVTHLSENALKLWLKEFHRVLKPGAILTLTTNGTGCVQYFSRKEKESYEKTGIVIRGGVDEGRKMFLAYHRPEYVRKAVSPDWEVLEFELSPQGMPFSGQDLWWLRAR